MPDSTLAGSLITKKKNGAKLKFKTQLNYNNFVKNSIFRFVIKLI